MFGSSEPHELIYANSAVIIALMKELMEVGILTPERTENVFSNAVAALEPHKHVDSVQRAIALINTGMRPKER